MSSHSLAVRALFKQVKKKQRPKWEKTERTPTFRITGSEDVHVDKDVLKMLREEALGYRTEHRNKNPVFRIEDLAEIGVPIEENLHLHGWEVALRRINSHFVEVIPFPYMLGDKNVQR